MVNFEHVTMIYDNGAVALKDINLHIDKGEFAFIVGASGAGKSTLMKLLMCELTPTSGNIQVNGFDLTTLKRRKIPDLRRTLGVVFQDFRLIDSMNVYENVAFALRVTDTSSKMIRRRVPYILGLVELSDKAKCMPRELSGGEQQRVALARALVNNPAFIIADEPTGNIDPALSYEIVELLNEINRCGTTILMVTHQHELVTRFPMRVITIENGTIASDTGRRGTPFQADPAGIYRGEASLV
ncbi:MAG: cell division ATP-binding protein FtsE [Ruminococcaceae bacterium]|nr:cell division ATP-binding protein FtsE [Oscillospiraceae bacterium]